MARVPGCDPGDMGSKPVGPTSYGGCSSMVRVPEAAGSIPVIHTICRYSSKQAEPSWRRDAGANTVTSPRPHNLQSKWYTEVPRWYAAGTRITYRVVCRPPSTLSAGWNFLYGLKIMLDKGLGLCYSVVIVTEEKGSFGQHGLSQKAKLSRNRYDINSTNR